ncbi:hypothetical protein Tco_0888977 [Tanacetum coccineum]
MRLPQPTPLVGVPSKENLNKYRDYHNEKGHSTNYCFYLKKQLEIALEFGKLNHLVKDVRQRGRVGQRNEAHRKARVRLVETQTKVSGFSEEQFKPLGKIELDVCFGGSGLCRNGIETGSSVEATGKKSENRRRGERVSLKQMLISLDYPEQLVAIGKDDMVVKSKSEREMLADIAETFDNLRRINMKLNPKSAHLG